MTFWDYVVAFPSSFLRLFVAFLFGLLRACVCDPIYPLSIGTECLLSSRRSSQYFPMSNNTLSLYFRVTPGEIEHPCFEYSDSVVQVLSKNQNLLAGCVMVPPELSVCP